MKPINWSWISQAIQYYVDNEYNYVEAPWIVQHEAVLATLPFNRHGFGLAHPNLNLGFLAGSAEQSFIQLMMERKLAKGKYCAAGPCFRDENVNEWQLYYFFKVELIEVSPNSKNLFEMMDCTRAFMENLGNCKIDIIKIRDGYDLIHKGIEIGSYGYRVFSHGDIDLNWIYGTGLALPRFTQALES